MSREPLEAPALSRARLAVLSATLATAVGLGTFPSFAFGVLAPFLRDEFGLSRSNLGLLTTFFFVVGAPASLAAGRVVDVAGGRSLLTAHFAAVAVTIVCLASAPSYGWLLLMSGLAGIPLAMSNPVTNKLVAHHASSGARGVIMGVKQSGVQMGAVSAGLVLPAAAHAWGWRAAIAIGLLPVALGLVGTLSVPTHGPARDVARTEERLGASRGLRALTVYAFLMGSGMAAMIAYLPLYAEERIGLSVTAAGALASSMGLMGVVARIFWGWRSERFSHLSLPLAVMSGGAVVGAALILLAQAVGSWVLVPAAALIGGTGAAWMAVGMLAIVTEVHGGQTGRASGMIIFGFFCGCIVSPLLFGYSVDETGSYAPGWLGVLTVFGLAGLIAIRWRRAWIREAAP
ncbi:MAG: MFS transporter [Actinomycetota bacterium]